MPRGTLSADPFLAWVDALDGDMGVVGEAMGLAYGTLTRAAHRVRTTQQQKVTLGMVDGAFTAADQPHMLAILYPQDVESMEDRWCPTCVELVTAGDDGLCPWCDTTVDEPRAAARARSARAERAQTSSMPTGRADERRRRAKQMRAEGMRYRDICAELGVAKSTVSGYVNS